jgi:hypothetical protein
MFSKCFICLVSVLFRNFEKSLVAMSCLFIYIHNKLVEQLVEQAALCQGVRVI